MIEFNPWVLEKDGDFNWATNEQRQQQEREIKAETKRILAYMKETLIKGNEND